MQRAYVLLSGGIDSAVCLYMAAASCDTIGVSINYGQRHVKEIDYARSLCADRGCTHVILDLKDAIPNTMLTDPRAFIPRVGYDQVKGTSPTYVPFRNALFLSALASYVHGCYVRHYGTPYQSEREWSLYFGANGADADNWAYPDCTPEFVGAMANAIYIGTCRAIRLKTPLLHMRKSEIINAGTDLCVPWRSTWSCYQGGEVHCGECPTCRERRAGFEMAGLPDPTIYQDAGNI